MRRMLRAPLLSRPVNIAGHWGGVFREHQVDHALRPEILSHCQRVDTAQSELRPELQLSYDDFARR
eukprot:4424100-Pyramimonas_sp.AAC.1